MGQLTTPEQLEHAESAFRAVFAEANYTEPFRPRLRSRLLLYPIDYVFLDAGQYDALGTASIRAGVSAAYLAAFGGEEEGWGGTYGHRFVDLHSYADYRFGAGTSPLEHFLFAPTAEWGLVTSDGEYALVAGADSFVAEIRSLLDYNEDGVVRAFVSDWREIERAGGSAEWMPRLLRHIFGAEKQSRLWKDAS